jgi:hypothetical protein
MKHIRKYNESKFDNTDLIHQIIDEITSVFNDNEWGEIESTCSGPGEPYQYSLKKYSKDCKSVIEYFKYELERYGHVSIGFKIIIDGNNILESISKYQEFLLKIKRIILNTSNLNIKIEDLYFKDTDLISFRIYDNKRI